jgi:hypothetical protein
MDEIKNFDDLPDGAVVPRRVTAAVLHISERTVQRSVPTVKLSRRHCGNRVGHIRAIARGDRPEIPTATDATDLSSEKSTIWRCFHRRHHLTLRDRQFIENLTDRHKPLSRKQQKWLCDIREKLERGR